MPAQFENGEKCDGCKIWASVHTILEQFENGRNLDGKNSLQHFNAKEAYLHSKRVDQSGSKSVKKCSVFIIFKFLHDAVSKMCRLEFRFQNLPFSKSAGKKMCRFRVKCACPSNFSPFSKCAGIVWTQSQSCLAIKIFRFSIITKSPVISVFPSAFYDNQIKSFTCTKKVI